MGLALKQLQRLDPDIRHRWRKMLAALELVAEGPAMKWEKSIRQSKSSGGPPRGAFRGGRKDDTPMYWWYRSHLDRAIDEGGPHDPRVLRLLWQAEADLKRTRYRSPVRAAETDSEFAKRVVDRYEGMEAEEAAWVYENVRVAVIHRARRMLGRHPETGYVDDDRKWTDLTDDEKKSVIAKFSSPHEASAELGINERTARRWRDK